MKRPPFVPAITKKDDKNKIKGINNIKKNFISILKFWYKNFQLKKLKNPNLKANFQQCHSNQHKTSIFQINIY